MPWLFALALFVGAVLLFAVQPMIGRMLLPLLGGSPAVWNTCLVFFQGALLLGYLYSHLTTRYLAQRWQVLAHVAMLAAVFFALPIAVPQSSLISDSPALWLLGALCVSVGLPFFVVSTTSPLLQRWYGTTHSRGSADPYFLSMASNAGCLAALLAYPSVIEPALRLSQQSDWWRWAYGGYVMLVAACALAMLGQSGRAIRARHSLTLPDDLSPTANDRSTGKWLTRARWLVFAFVPSSLLVGVTNAITTDIAPIPLLWVIPLSLYLLSFIIVFAPGVRLPFGLLGRLLAIGAVALALTLLVGATEPIWLVLSIHLFAFFVAAVVCHGRLAAERPRVEHLTSFYLWLSLGGVLGGAFNALAAPIVFHRLGFVEYPLAILAACMLRPAPIERLRFRSADLVRPLLVGLFAAGLVLLARLDIAVGWATELSEQTGLKPAMIRSAACFGLPLILAYTFVDRPIRFALGLGICFWPARSMTGRRAVSCTWKEISWASSRSRNLRMACSREWFTATRCTANSGSRFDRHTSPVSCFRSAPQVQSSSCRFSRLPTADGTTDIGH